MHHFKRAPIAVIYESFPAGLVSKNYSNYFLIIFFFYSSAVVVVFSPLFFFYQRNHLNTFSFSRYSIVVIHCWRSRFLIQYWSKGKKSFRLKKKMKKEMRERERKKNTVSNERRKGKKWSLELQNANRWDSKFRNCWREFETRKHGQTHFLFYRLTLKCFLAFTHDFSPNPSSSESARSVPVHPHVSFFCVWLFRYWFIDLECECLSIGPAHQLQRLESPRLFWIRHRVSCSGLVNEFDYQIGERCGDEFRNRRCLVWPL